MVKTVAFLVVLALAPISAFAGEYTVYSWHPSAKIAVRAGQAQSFSDARRSADVLAALHAINGGPQMDSQFSMISDPQDPLTTWVVQSAEPYQPHEYFWVGDKKDTSRNVN